MPPTQNTQLGSIATVALILLIGLMVGAGGAAAQASNNSTTTDAPPTTTASAPSGEGGTRIDGETVLLDKRYNDGSSTVILTLRSERKQYIVLTDAGSVFSGGTVPQKGMLLPEGRSTVRMQVTETEDGFVGVTLSTPDTLYAIPFDTGEDEISLSPDSPNDLLALFMGAGVISPVLIFGGFKLKQFRDSGSVINVE